MPSLKALVEKPVVTIYKKCIDTLRRHLHLHSAKLNPSSERRNLAGANTSSLSPVGYAQDDPAMTCAAAGQVEDEDPQELDDMISDFSPNAQRRSTRMNPSSTASISEMNRRSSIRLVVAEDAVDSSSSAGGGKSTVNTLKDTVNGRSIRGNWVVHTWGKRGGD